MGFTHQTDTKHITYAHKIQVMICEYWKLLKDNYIWN